MIGGDELLDDHAIVRRRELAYEHRLHLVAVLLGHLKMGFGDNDRPNTSDIGGASSRAASADLTLASTSCSLLPPLPTRGGSIDAHLVEHAAFSTLQLLYWLRICL